MQQNSWLYSDSFLKRAFAIWGHMIVAQLIIGVPLFIIWLVMVFMFFRSMGPAFQMQQNQQIPFPPDVQQPY